MKNFVAFVAGIAIATGGVAIAQTMVEEPAVPGAINALYSTSTLSVSEQYSDYNGRLLERVIKEQEKTNWLLRRILDTI